jgi:hypothetical protein
MVKPLLVSLTLIAGPAFADQAAAPARPAPSLGSLRPAQKVDPYRRLFDAQAALKAALAQQSPTRLPTPLVMCGTTLLPGDPNIDPKIYVGSTQDGPLRKVPPPPCNPAR